MNKSTFTRKNYEASREAFFSSSEPVVAMPLLTRLGDQSGWGLYRGESPLMSSRGGVRTFRELSSAAKFCSENSIDGFSVWGLNK